MKKSIQMLFNKYVGRVTIMNKKALFILIFVLLILCVLRICFKVSEFKNKYTTDSKYLKYQVRVVELVDKTKDRLTYLVKLNRGKNIGNKFYLNVFFLNKYDSHKNMSKEKIEYASNYVYGDILEVTGKIKISEILGNVGEFDYQRYLNSKNIYGVINSKKIEHIDNISTNELISKIYEFKEKSGKRIDKYLTKTRAGLLKSMLYGDKKYLNENIEDDFKNIGISHLIAVSGSNISIILTIYIFVFSKFKNNRILNIIFSSVIIFSYAVLSSLELSIIRSGVFSITAIIFESFNIKKDSKKVLSYIFITMILVNPMCIYNAGMVLSFLGTLGIILFSKIIMIFLQSKIEWKYCSYSNKIPALLCKKTSSENKSKSNLENSLKIILKVLKNILIKVSVPISITLSANIMLFPVLIVYFNSFSFCFLLSNIIASFLDSIIVALGVILIIVPEISIVFVGLFKIEQIMLDILIKMADMLSKMDLEIPFRTPNIVFVILWYVLICLIYISFDNNKRKILLKYKLQRIRRIVITLIILTICSSKIYYTYFDDYVYFFNVGQGDMALVKENNNTLLIDSGSITNNANSILENYLKHENISSISYVVLSHFHEDHINYFYDIAEKYKVKGVIYSTVQNYEEEEYIKFKNYLKNKEISEICVEETDKIDIGEKLSIKVIAPLKNKKYNIKDLNEISLVVKVCINNKNILFMGDATKKSEINILESSSIYLDNISILKVGHHGSKTSTSEEFLKTLNTKFAVISSKKSEYGHPDKEVVDLLERYSIKTFITEKVGGIKIKL